MILTPATAGALGGASQRWRANSLRDLMRMTEYDPDATGAEWTLVVTDTHVSYDKPLSGLDERIALELQRLATNAPKYVLHLGDLLGRYVGWGGPPNVSYGTIEMAQGLPILEAFDNLAPLKMILGNHDCHTGEEPLGAFMLANCPYFTSLTHTVIVGGVKFVMLSTRQDGSLPQDQIDYFYAAVMSLESGQECVLCIHHPGGGIAYDYKGFIDLWTNYPLNAPKEKIWMLAGHDHYTNNTVAWQLPNGEVLSEWLLGTGSRTEVVHFSDGELPQMFAICCKNGAVTHRYAWCGIYRLWFAQQQESRSNPSDIPRHLMGLDNETVLSKWEIGVEDFTGRYNNTEGLNKYWKLDSWNAHCYDLQMNFPLPAGASKFWVVMSAKPANLSLSADGITWTAMTPVPSLVTSTLIVTIPEPLRSGPFLHCRIFGTDTHISAFGFAQ